MQIPKFLQEIQSKKIPILLWGFLFY